MDSKFYMGCLALLAFMLPTKTMADISGNCGMDGSDVTYYYASASKILTISGTGEMNGWYIDSSPWASYAADIIRVIIDPGVTSIGSYAFYGCSNMTTISIPESVVSIKGAAFQGCSSLQTPIAIPVGQACVWPNTFYGCSSLQTVILPDGLEYIDRYAFYGCSSLASIDIPASVNTINDEAFRCSGLTSVYIPSGVSQIGIGVFAYCPNLTSIRVDENSQSYDSRENCNAIIIKKEGWMVWTNTMVAECKTTTFPASVTRTDTYFRAGRTDLTVYKVPETLYELGQYAFADCTNLTTLIFPPQLGVVGHYSLTNCTSMRDIYIYYNDMFQFRDYFLRNVDISNVTFHAPASMVDYYQQAFPTCKAVVALADLSKPVLIDGIYYKIDAETKTAAVTACPEGAAAYTGALTIPATVELEYMTYTVTSVETDAFAACDGLTALNVAAGNTFISAPDGCNAIIETATATLIAGCNTSTIPSTVTAIGPKAFLNRSGLTALTLHDGITAVGAEAFAGCTGLTSIECYAEAVPEIGDDAFADVTATVRVPATTLESYRTALAPFTGLTVKSFPEKCKTPTLVYGGGKLRFMCETDGVTFHSSVTLASSAQESTDAEIALTPVYHVTVYASKEDYIDSDTAVYEVNALGMREDVNGDGRVTIADVTSVVEVILGE